MFRRSLLLSRLGLLPGYLESAQLAGADLQFQGVAGLGHGHARDSVGSGDFPDFPAGDALVPGGGPEDRRQLRFNGWRLGYGLDPGLIPEQAQLAACNFIVHQVEGHPNLARIDGQISGNAVGRGATEALVCGFLPDTVLDFRVNGGAGGVFIRKRSAVIMSHI